MSESFYSNNYEEESLSKDFLDMLTYVIRENGDLETVDPKEITDFEEIEFYLKKYYTNFDSLEPLKEFLPYDNGFHEYLNNLTSKFNKEISDNLRNNEKLEETQKNLNFKSGTANQNKNKKDDIKSFQAKQDYQERFQEKKLEFLNKRNGLDFDNLIEQVYPKEYIPNHHDNDIKEILKNHKIDNMNLDPKNHISHDNFKLLLVLIKNKKAALFENNFYNIEYSTDWEKIVKGNIDKNKSTFNNKNNDNTEDYVDQFKMMLKVEKIKKDNNNQ